MGDFILNSILWTLALYGLIEIIKTIINRGVSEEIIDTVYNSGINIKKWLHGFDSVEESVKDSVEVVRKHPLIPKDVRVHGLVIDSSTGELEVIVDGNK